MSQIVLITGAAQDPQHTGRYRPPGGGRSGAAILEKPVSESGMLEDLSQLPPFESTRSRKPLILKGRDGRVVYGARLENESGDAHREILNRLFAQSIQRLPATECFSM